jgi:phosphotransferase system HPr-like phosphotransfer protein
VNATSKLVKAWESKNAKNAAKAGGVSLMALSLAACGGSDEEIAAVIGSAVADAAAAEAAATAAAEAAAATAAAEAAATAAAAAAEAALEAAGPAVTTLATTALTADTTLLPTGDLVGGDGAANELVLNLAANFAGFNAATATDPGSMTGFETVSLFADNIARTFNATGVTGVETFKIDGTSGGVVSITNSAELTDISLANIATGAFSVTYAAPVGGTSPVAGTADTLNIAVEGLGSATADIAITAAGVETTSILSNAAATAAGATNFIDLTNLAASDIIVSGKADLDIAGVHTSFATLDASALDAAITADTTNAGGRAAGDITSIKTGSGDDKITVTTTDLNVVGTVDLGTGADILNIDGGAATLRLVMSGTETLDVTDQTGALVLNMRDTTGVEKVSMTDAGVATTGATAYAGTLTMSSATGDLAVEINGDSAGGGITTDTTGNVTIDVNTNVDATSAAFNNANTAVDADNAATLTIDVDGFTDLNGAVSAAAATSVTVNTEKTASPGAIVAALAETVSFAAAGTYTSAGDTFTTAKVINMDAAAAMNFAGTAFAAAVDVNLSGSAAASAITLGTLGAATLQSAIDITGEGLTAGLTTGAVDAGSGILTIDVTKVTGDVTHTTLAGGSVSFVADDILGDVVMTTVTADTGAITMSAVDSVGGFQATNLDASGAVNVDLSGLMGVGTLGTSTGSTVTITADGADGNVAAALDGVITADSAVTISAKDQTSLANYNATASATATSLTVTNNTGTGIDTITATAGALTGTVIVAGDFGGAEADTITINMAGSGVATGQTVTITATDYATSILTLDAEDTIATGGEGADTINAGAATNTLNGGAGIDTITGNTGVDTINGGGGADEIDADGGADVITTGGGADDILTAVVADSAASVAANTTVTFDTIVDFTTGSDEFDVILLADILAGAANATGATVTALSTGAASLNDTTIATFAELKVAIDAVGLIASAAGASGAATGLQVYTIDLAGNTGALGTGRYMLLNDNDTVITATDAMFEIGAASDFAVAADFIL